MTIELVIFLALFFGGGFGGIFVIAFLVNMTILRDFESGVVFTLGRYTGTRGQGFRCIIPLLQEMERVDLRVRAHTVRRQHVITQDNVAIESDAVISYRVIDPESAVTQVEDFEDVTLEQFSATLCSVLGKHTLEEILANRGKFNQEIKDCVNAETKKWGVEVVDCSIKQLELEEIKIRSLASS